MTTNTLSNRALLYARQSSAKQNEVSRAGQFDDMASYALDKGLVDAGRFEDVATGLNTDKRPGLLRMFAVAFNPDNRISHIIFYDLSRFSRGRADPHVYMEMLDEHDIIVHSVTDGKSSDVDEFDWDVKFSLNNKQSRDISRLSIKGQRDSILAGYAISSKIPYGYQRGWVEGKKGENANTRLHPIYEPHPVHADHVRMMFKMRAKGSSTGEIGEHLMMLGIPSPSGKKDGRKAP